MKAGGNKFRKRPRQTPGDKAALSASLRQIGDHIQKRDIAAGLSKADQALSSPGLTVHNRSRVLALVGDSEFKRGRFAEAAQIQLQAASESLDHATLWLRPHIGHVRALLKVPQVDQAVMMARHAVDLAETKMGDFDEQVRLAAQSVTANGSVPVPSVPPRVSVVATRMGYLFLQEGEPEAAQEFFERAIQASKGGANRARQGLAKIALAKGAPGEAMQIASDAIRRGGYRAKTLPAWEILIAARHQVGGWKISERLIKGLNSAPAELRARTILTIVRELRKNDMRQWREVAQRWSSREGAQFPIIAAEMHKMALSSAKTEPGNPTDKRGKAEQLLQTPGLSPNEWLSAAKEQVRAGLWEGRNINIPQLLATARAKYGEDFAPKATHSLALSCMMAKRHDLARPLLQSNIQKVANDQGIWGKSVWALARMEGLLGDHATAAARYRQFFEENSMPVRFRLQAQLLWCQELIASGQMNVLLEARSLMTAALRDVQDPEILMNFARQMLATSPELEDWRVDLFNQGAAFALNQYGQAAHPSLAISILYKLTRRQVVDFGCSSQAIQFWENMSQDKIAWLWSAKASFWEYLGLLMDAYLKTDQIEKAESFMNEWFDDPATPPEGRVQVGIPYGNWLASHSKGAEALALFDNLILESPNHPLSAHAWYWKALSAHKHGDKEERNRCVACLRRAQGMNPALQSQWFLDAKALLLLADLQIGNIDPQAINYAPSQLEALRGELEHEMGALP